MRYHVRNADGEELVCPSLADLHSLYDQGFLSDDDFIRANNSERWVRAANMPAFRGVREQRKDPRKMALLLAAAMALTLAILLLVKFKL
jgi:hypothetical protein